MANLVLCVIIAYFGLKNTFSVIYMQILSAASMKQLTSWYSPPMLMNALKILLALSLCMIIAFSTDQLFFSMVLLQIPATASMKQLRSCSSTLYQRMHKACQYFTYVPILLKKKQTNLNVLTTDTFSSFIEAVDELFQHTLSYECMEHHVHTIAIICMWLLPILPPKNEF